MIGQLALVAPYNWWRGHNRIDEWKKRISVAERILSLV